MKNSVRVVIYLLRPLHFALRPQQRNRKHREIFSPLPNLSPSEFAKILSDVWFEVEVPGTRTTKQRGVNDGTPHNRVPKYIQCAERGRIHDYQHKYRHHEMARPRFARGKTVRDRSHQAADHRDERGGDMQPFRASHFFTAHEVRPDVENRERDRDKHSCGCERREPAQDSNAQGLLHLM